MIERRESDGQPFLFPTFGAGMRRELIPFLASIPFLSLSFMFSHNMNEDWENRRVKEE